MLTISSLAVAGRAEDRRSSPNRELNVAAIEVVAVVVKMIASGRGQSYARRYVSR